MAYIREVRPSPRFPKPRWRVYHETAAGEVKVGVYDTLTQAERVRDRVNRYGLDAILDAVATRHPARPEDKSRTPLGQYVQERWWPAWKAAHPDSEPSTKYQLNARILPRFGDVPLAELDADTIGLWKGDMLTEGLKPRTINTYMSLLGTILNAAVDAGYLDRSPMMRRSGAGRVAILRNLPVTKREVWLTREQLDRLADAIAPRYRALILTAALTGLRWGELSALRWRHIRLNAYTYTDRTFNPDFPFDETTGST